MPPYKRITRDIIHVYCNYGMGYQHVLTCFSRKQARIEIDNYTRQGFKAYFYSQGKQRLPKPIRDYQPT